MYDSNFIGLAQCLQECLVRIAKALETNNKLTQRMLEQNEKMLELNNSFEVKYEDFVNSKNACKERGKT